jgi:hypothetical protein
VKLLIRRLSDNARVECVFTDHGDVANKETFVSTFQIDGKSLTHSFKSLGLAFGILGKQRYLSDITFLRQHGYDLHDYIFEDDTAAFDLAKAALARGEDEIIPFEVIEERLAKEK